MYMRVHNVYIGVLYMYLHIMYSVLLRPFQNKWPGQLHVWLHISLVSAMHTCITRVQLALTFVHGVCIKKIVFTYENSVTDVRVYVCKCNVQVFPFSNSKLPRCAVLNCWRTFTHEKKNFLKDEVLSLLFLFITHSCFKTLDV